MSTQRLTDQSFEQTLTFPLRVLTVNSLRTVSRFFEHAYHLARSPEESSVKGGVYCDLDEVTELYEMH